MTAQYIVLEGVDASGKTTMAKRLVSWLGEKSVKAIYTGHPGATQFGQQIRTITHNSSVKLDPLTEALTFVTDHNAFIEQILKPSLKEDTWVIADRNNFISGIAYQIASGCSLEDLYRVQDIISDPPKIDVLFVLHAERSTLSRRSCNRGVNDRYESLMKRDDYYNKVSMAYSNMIQSNEYDERLLKFIKPTTTTPRIVPRIIGVDTNKDMDDVYGDIVSVVETLIHETSRINS